MEDGKFTFFIVQWRLAYRRKPGAKRWTEDRDDSWSSGDWNATACGGWVKGANPPRIRDKKASDESHLVWCSTGYHGWWTIEPARRALGHLRKADEQGWFNWKDTYQHVTEEVRHDFRIIKMVLSKATTIHCVDVAVVEEPVERKKRGFNCVQP